MVDQLRFSGHSSLMSATKFCDEARISSQAFNKALLDKRIFSVGLNGHVCVPGFFLDKRYERRQMTSVCKLLGHLSGGSKLQFFTTAKGSLGGQTPLEALADRKFAAVRRTAQGFAER